MPKITNRQKAKLLVHLMFLTDMGKIEYLRDCGYVWVFSSHFKHYCFVRIDSVNWKEKYKRYRPNIANRFNTPHGTYLEAISRDALFKDKDVHFDWHEVGALILDKDRFSTCNYHVDLSFLN